MLCAILCFYGMVPILILCVSHAALFVIKRWLKLSLRTTYIGQVLANETGKEPDSESATRMGDLALLLFSIGTHHISGSMSKFSFISSSQWL